MKKIENFNITFICENGKFELERCTKLPTLEQFEECADNLQSAGIGELQKVVIEKFEWNEKD